jgi:hypothetical protein
MAFVDSKNSVFKLDDSGGVLRTLTAYVDNVDGLPGGRTMDDVTALGDTGHKFIPGIANQTFSISGHWDSTATTGPNAVLAGLAVSATATATFEHGPEGSSTGNIKYTGECWCTEYKVTSAAGSKVSFTASFQVDGVVTLTTY